MEIDPHDKDMASSRKNSTGSRAKLPQGEQQKFIEAAIAKSGGVDMLASNLGVSARTVRDWRREKFLILYAAIPAIAKKYKIPFPSHIQKVNQFWYVTKGARKGGLASYWKQGGTIGDPRVRKRKWLKWWKEKGRLEGKFLFHPLPFRKPKRSVKLAEFIGLMMGDGGMTKRQISITLHHVDDFAYSRFVISLIEELFSLTPTVRHVAKNSVNIIVVSRSRLVTFLNNLGLPIGNKIRQNFDVPEWIRRNESYMIACIRGLVDTDGSVFTHKYRVNGKQYLYKKLSFCSASLPLRRTVKTFLQNHGFHVRASRGIDLRIESKSGMARYMQLIGSHNEKHLKRYLN